MGVESTHIHLIPHASAAVREQLRGRAVVVVDTLRATSTVAALLATGAASVYPAATVEGARALRDALGPSTLLCGERGGLPPEGFDAGNSPREAERLGGRGAAVVLTTTNGTLALERAWKAQASARAPVVTAALVNARSVAGVLAAWGVDIAIVCAGERGGSVAADEDLYTAGYLARLLDGLGATLSPAVEQAVAMVARAPDPAAALAGFHHAQELARLGLAADVTWCAQPDRLDVVPVLVTAAGGTPHLVAMASPGAALPFPSGVPDTG